MNWMAGVNICISIFLLGVEFVVQQDQYVGGGWLTVRGLTLSTRILAHPHPHPGYIWSWWAHISKYFSINTIKTVTTCGKLFSLSTLHFRPHHRVTTIDRLKALVSRWGNSDEGEVINRYVINLLHLLLPCPALPSSPPLSSLLPPPTNHS